MTQITFPYDRAQQALAEFLSGDEDGQDRLTGGRWTRNISTPDGNGLAAVIMDPAKHAQLRDEAAAWREHMEPKGDTDIPPGYRPYQHSPTAREDRLLPTEPLEKTLAQVFYGKNLDELDRDDRSKILSAAIICLLRTTLDPDDSGVVPIMMRCHSAEDRNDPEPRQLWQLAYKTGVHGLYLRTTANGFFGELWGIVTGTGFKLTEGWWDRESAEQAVAAVGRVLPQVDWMEVRDADAFTPAAVAALRQVFKRYRDFGVDENQPEPEPVTTQAADGSALAGASGEGQ
ncbi:hypothetical protein Sme01_03710 [Sphaerisporangium melleum]|uniref:Uncharacterized protein n=1 Tax=Sphaerisporangium melleum TaxID=321316 RepID=A0A917VC87_9ACTN|nr:hypothetical protein [Sphaerisporangium melleum]GGK61857.1 hypothetical protein GCM10007964_01260 [Sphaerisporangium melleum]GII67895.1 hypothetical protein Sme01_03710 [Sphaerisporangium melleum]